MRTNKMPNRDPAKQVKSLADVPSMTPDPRDYCSSHCQAPSMAGKTSVHSSALVVDAAFQDLLTSRIRDTVASVFQKDWLVYCIRDIVASALEKESGTIRGAFHESYSHLETQQSDFLEHQQSQLAAYMKAILGHLENLNQTVTKLEERCGNIAVLGSFATAGASGLPQENKQEPTMSEMPQISALKDASPKIEIDGEDERNAESIEFVGQDSKGATNLQDIGPLGHDKQGSPRMQHLSIVIHSADSLRNSDMFSKSDPYCICRYANKRSEFELQTPVIHNTLHPVWDYRDDLGGYVAGDSIHFSVYDHDDLDFNDFLGEATLSSSAIEQHSGGELELEMQNCGGGVHSKLYVTVSVKDGPPRLRSALEIKRCSRVIAHLEDADKMEETAADQEERKILLDLIRRIPSRPVRMALAFVSKKWHEPERTGPVAAIETSSGFLTTSMLVIVADQVITAIATNYCASHIGHRRPYYFDIFERVCLAWFILELVLKIYVHRIFFFLGSSWKMNTLDLFLVVYGFVEALGLDLSFLRALRIFKVAKIVRMCKALRAVRDLRIMMDCLIGSGFTVFWGVVLILFLMYMFSLVMVQAMTDYLVTNYDTMSAASIGMISKRFGSVQDGCLSLFMALTGGLDWKELYDLLEPSGPVGAIACIAFILLFTMSVWNIIGSVFVEKVMAMSEPTPHRIMQRKMLQEKLDTNEIRQFFTEYDVDASGTICCEEWLKIIKHGSLAEYLGVRDIKLQDNQDIASVFQLAKEHDQSRGIQFPEEEMVTIDALVYTCQRLKGAAKCFEIAVLRSEMRRHMEVIKSSVESSSRWVV